MSLIIKAREFANEKHGSKMYGVFPYMHHLDNVVDVLFRFDHGDDSDLVIAGYLHDLMEDEGVTFEEIEDIFGTIVATLVWSVSGFGKNRKERRAMILNNLVGFSHGITLKLADRIANMESSLLTNLLKLDMYLKEQAEFEQAIRNETNSDMWKHLDYLVRVGTFALFQERYNK